MNSYGVFPILAHNLTWDSMFRISQLPEDKRPKVLVICQEDSTVKERITELLKSKGIDVATPVVTARK